MHIYIPTLLRNQDQITLRSLPQVVHLDVTLVVDKHDKASSHLKGDFKTVVCPKRGIGAVRQWIVDNHDVRKCGPALLMLDDDLRFFKRREDDPTKFLKATATDIILCLHAMAEAMGKYAHGGILAREGGNRVQSSKKENTRLLRALAYDVRVLKKVGARFDRLPVMEDFDVALQLIEAGYPNVAICDWVQDQTRSNAPGGCSTYRTLEVQAAGARGLAKLHPNVVTVLEKTTSTAWNGATRTDVKVFWQKAFKKSQK